LPVSEPSSPSPRPGLRVAAATQVVAPTPNERLTSLYREHGALVFRLALRYGGDRSWAEDLTQEVFLQAFAHIDELAQVDNPAGWLYRVTTRRCLNRLRGQRLRASAPVRWALHERVPVPNTPEELGIHRQRLAALFTQLETLPPKQRVCFWMYHVDGKSVVEIGEIIGHSKGYVSKLLDRATRELKASASDV
jgi:RNA polymerase sigma-70 factor (ECF subfamily)